MIVRFTLSNVFSFGEECELSLIPYARLRHHKHHINYDTPLPLLRYTAIYGANGAGKSNLLKALRLLIDNVKGNTYINVKDRYGKLDLYRHRNLLLPPDTLQEMAVEFVPKGSAFSYYYCIKVQKNIVISEKLTTMSFRKNGSPSSRGDVIVFSREKIEGGYVYRIPKLENLPGWEDYVNKFIPSLISEDVLAFGIVAKLNNDRVGQILDAYSWLTQKVIVVTPNSYNFAWPYHLWTDELFREFYNTMFPRFDTGINEVCVQSVLMDDNSVQKLPQEIKDQLEYHDFISLTLPNQKTPTTYVKDSNGNITSLTVKSRHASNVLEKPAEFDFDQESDGTIRLADILAMAYDVINTECVYLIDEVDDRIHPIAMIRLIQLLTSYKDVKGQLIFTTHNAHLLDADLLRKDEIWFVEKNREKTTLYSLSDYCQEHNNIDITKGYLQGRYGGVPIIQELRMD